MPKASRDKLGNKGKQDTYLFDPEDVVLVAKEGSALYDERVDNDFKESLVLNMMFEVDGVPIGVIKPLKGRRNTETGKIEIIDGRQRTKALREANKRRKKQGLEPIWLPVHIVRANDQRSMAMLISANEHATEDSPLNRAKKAQRYIDLSRDEKEVAVLLGVSEATVKNLLKLLDAPAAVRNAADAGKITMTDACRLAKEEPEEAKKLLDQLLEHAPRTPGKKRSKNAKKAAAILGKTSGAKKTENEVAEAIASWIAECCDSLAEVPDRIRKGEWRKKRKKAESDAAAE